MREATELAEATRRFLVIERGEGVGFGTVRPYSKAIEKGADDQMRRFSRLLFPGWLGRSTPWPAFPLLSTTSPPDRNCLSRRPFSLPPEPLPSPSIDCARCQLPC